MSRSKGRGAGGAAWVAMVHVAKCEWIGEATAKLCCDRLRFAVREEGRRSRRLLPVKVLTLLSCTAFCSGLMSRPPATESCLRTSRSRVVPRRYTVPANTSAAINVANAAHGVEDDRFLRMPRIHLLASAMRRRLRLRRLTQKAPLTSRTSALAGC